MSTATRKQIHLSYIYKTHFADLHQAFRFNQYEDEFAWFMAKASSHPDPRFYIKREKMAFCNFAEVWMWYRYYTATVRTWQHDHASFRNQAYWSRIPSHYRSLKHMDQKIKSLEAIIKGVEKRFPGMIERFQNRLDGGECGFVWRVNSQKMNENATEAEESATTEEAV